MALFDLTTKWRAVLCFALCCAGLAATIDAQGTVNRSITAERFYTGGATFDLLVSGRIADRLREAVQSAAPRLGLELLATVPVPFDPRSAAGQLQLYRLLLSAGTMQGTEYYSASRGQMRVLYQESYTIAGPTDRTRVPDHRPAQLAPYHVYHAFQRDGSFGRNVQRIEVWTDELSFLMATTNETTMFYNLLPLIRPGALRTFIIVRPGTATGESNRYVEIYAHLAANVGSLFGLEARAHQSLYNRVVALIAWFEAQIQTDS